jgi:ubiquinol-cytochrome c reductase cytochrome c1 subunit
MMRTLLAALCLVPALVLAAEGGYRLDSSPHNPNDLVSLQSGARTFVNYCLNCHGAQFMRYNRLQDIGLTEAQIRDNLMFPADKVGETMRVSLSTKDGKDKAGHVALEYKWTQISPGTQNTVQYDETVRDLVNFLVYVGEPAGESRKHIGAIVLFVLSILFVFAYALKKAYWKDVH